MHKAPKMFRQSPTNKDIKSVCLSQKNPKKKVKAQGSETK